MADITDGLGRVSNGNADFEALKKAMESVVKKTMDFAEKRTQRAEQDNASLEGRVKDLESGLNQNSDRLEENTKAAREFVNKVAEMSDSISKKKEAPRKQSADEKMEEMAKKQLKVLKAILKEHHSASNSANITGPTGAMKKAKAGAYGPQGKDNIPAYLQEGEVVLPKHVAKKGAFVSPTKALALNQGGVVRRGGAIKPQYLAKGTGPISIPGRILDILGAMPSGTADAVVEVGLDTSGLDEEAIKAAEIVEQTMNSRLQKVGGYMTSISTQLMGGHKFTDALFGGVVEDATKVRKEMREIAFQSQGITGNFRDMQASFADVGKNVVAETGKSVTALKDALAKNVKKGMGQGGLDSMKSTLKSGLYMSTMIGSETQQTADMFADWHRQLSLSSNQMDMMARNMRSVALSTGVTGDELLEVMKSSQNILKTMRNQGTLTADSARNIITMMAEAKKTGDEEMTSELLTSMSSLKNMQNASMENKSLLYTISNRMDANAGGKGTATRDMTFGRFANKRENFRGVEAETFKIFQERAKLQGVEVNSFEDADKLSAEVLGNINAGLVGMGTSVEQLKQLNNQSRITGQGLAGQLADQQKLLDNRYATEQERMLASQKMNEMYAKNAQNYLSTIREKSSNMPLPEILSELESGDKFSSLREDFLAMAGALDPSMKGKFGISGSADQQRAQMQALSGQQKMQLMSSVAADQLMKAAKAQGKNAKDFSSAAMNVNDNESFNKFNEELQAEFKSLDIDSSANVDPTTKLNLTMLDLNETIRGYLSPLIGGFVDLIGATGLLALQLGLLTGSLYAFYGKGLLTLIKTLKGGGVGGISGAASSVANPFAKMGGAMGKQAAKTAAANAKSANIFRGFFSKIFREAKGLAISFYAGVHKAKKAGNGFFTSIGKGFTRAAKSTSFGRGVLNFSRASGLAVSRFGTTFKTAFDRSRKQGVTLFKSLQSGFSYAMKSTDATRGVLHGFSTAMTSLNGKYIETLGSIKKVSPALSNFIRHSVNLGKSFTMLKFGEIIPRFAAAMRSGFRVFKNAFNPASWKALPGLVSAGFKGARASIVAGSFGTAQIVFAAIDMVFGAVTGFMNTGKNFEGVMKAMGKTTKDMTWGMYASSTVAGGLVGILDGLTFGLLSMTGAAEWLNQTLSLLLYTVFSVVEGIVNGLVAAFQMVWSAIKYIGKQFEGIGNSFLEIFNSIAGVFGAEASNFSEMFAMIYPWLKRIGTVIGFIVGGPLMGFLWLIVKGISLVLVPVQMLIAAFAAVFKIVRAFAKFFWDWGTVGIGQAFMNLGSSLLKAVYGIFAPVVDFVASLASDIVAPFKWLYNILVGNSIVPDLCTAIVGFFGKMAMNVIKFVAGIPGKVLGGLYNVFIKGPVSLLKKGAGFVAKVAKSAIGFVKDAAKNPGVQNVMKKMMESTFLKGPIKVFNKMFKFLNTKTLKSGLSMISSNFGSFFKLFRSNLSGLTNFFASSWYSFLNTASGGLFGKLVNGIKNSKIAQIVSDYLIKPISEGLQWLGNRAGEVFGWLKNKAKDVVTGAKNVAKSAYELGKGVLNRFGIGAGTSADDTAAAAAKAAAKVANPFAKMSGDMGKQAAKTASVADDAAKAAAKVANPFAKMSGDMGKQAAKTASIADDAAKASVPFGKGIMSFVKGVASKFLPDLGKQASVVDDAVSATTKAGSAAVASVADDAAVAATKATSDAGVKGGAKAVSTAASGVDDIAKTAPAALGFLGKSSKLIGSLAKKLPVVGPLLDFGIRKVTGQSTGKAVAGTTASIGGGLAGAAAGAAIGTLIFPGVGTAIGGAFGLIGGIMGGIGAGMASDAIYDAVVDTSESKINKATTAASVGTNEAELVRLQKAAEAAGNGLEVRSTSLATPVGQHAVPISREEDVSSVQPIHLRDISQTMLRERASAQDGTKPMRSDELTRIQEASDEQVYELQQIREGIASLVEYMRPTGSVLGSSEATPGSTKDPIRPDHAKVFGRRKYGEPGGQPSRSLVNNGEV